MLRGWITCNNFLKIHHGLDLERNHHFVSYNIIHYDQQHGLHQNDKNFQGSWEGVVNFFKSYYL
jgi:hypothetical protein